MSLVWILYQENLHDQAHSIVLSILEKCLEPSQEERLLQNRQYSL